MHKIYKIGQWNYAYRDKKLVRIKPVRDRNGKLTYRVKKVGRMEINKVQAVQFQACRAVEEQRLDSLGTAKVVDDMGWIEDPMKYDYKDLDTKGDGFYSAPCASRPRKRIDRRKVHGVYRTVLIETYYKDGKRRERVTIIPDDKKDEVITQVNRYNDEYWEVEQNKLDDLNSQVKRLQGEEKQILDSARDEANFNLLQQQPHYEVPEPKSYMKWNTSRRFQSAYPDFVRKVEKEHPGFPVGNIDDLTHRDIDVNLNKKEQVDEWIQRYVTAQEKKAEG